MLVNFILILYYFHACAIKFKDMGKLPDQLELCCR